MTEPRESLDAPAHLRGSLVRSHLVWADEHLSDPRPALLERLESPYRQLVERPVLPTAWVPFAGAVALDKAIAALVGGDPREVYDALGRASARQNLTGSYRFYQAEDPHRFFTNSATLHSHFQDFGTATYEALDGSRGRFTIGECAAYSPVHCAGERGFLAEALVVLGVTEEPAVSEAACCCAGDERCVFDIGW